MTAALDEIADELAAIADRLRDMAFEALRDAVQAGDSKRPDLERRLTRARHGLERVIGVLRGATPGDSEDD